MTRKDFVLIAETIRMMDTDTIVHMLAGKDIDAQAEIIGTYAAKTFADALRSTNPNFKRDVFLKACGVES